MALISPVSSPNGKIFNQKLYARIRVATESDVPHIYKLMQQLFVYHNIIHLLKSTQSSIASGLFKPKFTNISPVTTLLVEVSANPFPSCPTDNAASRVKEVELNLPLVDKESEQFRVVKDDHDDVFIAGFGMFYPGFSSFFEKPVFHMENFFLRECYRRKGFGKWLFSTMASEAARMGYLPLIGMLQIGMKVHLSFTNKWVLPFLVVLGIRVWLVTLLKHLMMIVTD
ncbi:putative acetyltransferase NATA1-like [Capsicum galapagoense]